MVLFGEKVVLHQLQKQTQIWRCLLIWLKIAIVLIIVKEHQFVVFLLEEAAYFGLVVIEARGNFVQLRGAFRLLRHL